jgi:hypothetical protein
MRNLIVAWRQLSAAGGDEAQATVLNFQSASIKPDQPVPIGVGDARLVQTQASSQH